jgi:hypothetical protein
MKSLRLAVCGLVLVGLMALGRNASGQQVPDLESANDLSVLYAGDPESPRTEAWVAFLEQWFPDVGAIAIKDLNEESASAYDVIVADWRARYDAGSYVMDQQGHGASLPPGFSRPVIMIGAMGAELAPRTTWFTWL